LLEQLESDPAHQKDAGLGVFGPGQFCVRTVETNRSKIKTKRTIRTVEPCPGAGKLLGEVFAHTDDLGAMSGKKQCSLAHRDRELNTNPSNSERMKNSTTDAHG